MLPHVCTKLPLLKSAHYNDLTWLLGKRLVGMQCNDYVTDVGNEQWLLVDG